MNKKTNLQIPISVAIKMKAKQKAETQGFSSLQELVRVFITNYANTDMGVIFDSLSPAAEARLEKDLEETIKGIESGDIKVHNSTEDALKYLKSQ